MGVEIYGDQTFISGNFSHDFSIDVDVKFMNLMTSFMRKRSRRREKCRSVEAQFGMGEYNPPKQAKNCKSHLTDLKMV